MRSSCVIKGTKMAVELVLLSMHNIYYLLNLMQRARQAIIEGRYGAFVSDWMNSPAAVDY